jgi:hypothetical protein
MHDIVLEWQLCRLRPCRPTDAQSFPTVGIPPGFTLDDPARGDVAQRPRAPSAAAL